MQKQFTIQGIIFDYGGTIDSNGLHWAEVIWQAYQAYHVPITKEIFRDAYVFGERTLAKNPIIRPHHTFRDMMYLKCDLQLNQLIAAHHLPADCNSEQNKRLLADWCYHYARKAIDAALPTLRRLALRYPMVLVSNFYGNIEAVLKDFGLEGLFQSIIESAVVGVRKPDPRIFRLGVDALQLSPAEVVVIGDSYDKDILPASQLGCHTIWLKNIGWAPYKGDETADAVISDFDQLIQHFPV
ncbi:HAD family hydrolase [Parabacteroides sp. OttesenSCG-928-N08]|nr:HAD family hydrolase [Parabacteroides sp. OttesenSCG-928-N08]